MSPESEEGVGEDGGGGKEGGWEEVGGACDSVESPDGRS